MDSKYIILFNDLGLKIYDGNIYNGLYKKETLSKNKDEIKKKLVKILFVSQGYPGKTSLIMTLIGREFYGDTIQTIGLDHNHYNYQNNNKQYSFYYIKLLEEKDLIQLYSNL